MKPLDSIGAPFRPDRPSSQLLHDVDDLRVVSFALEPHQEVKPHRSPSTVMLQVIEGEGTFSGGAGEIQLAAGGTAVFERDEIHGIRAGDRPLRFLAIITPRPS